MHTMYLNQIHPLCPPASSLLPLSWNNFNRFHSSIFIPLTYFWYPPPIKTCFTCLVWINILKMLFHIWKWTCCSYLSQSDLFFLTWWHLIPPFSCKQNNFIFHSSLWLILHCLYIPHFPSPPCLYFLFLSASPKSPLTLAWQHAAFYSTWAMKWALKHLLGKSTFKVLWY
jgi:hypothetical protein